MSDNNEREISIGELFLHAIRHWKLIILGAVLGAILLGGYSYYKSVKNYNKAVKEQESNAEEQKELTQSEKDYVDTIVNQYENAIQAQKDYAETYLGKMDAQNVYEKDLNYYIKLVEDIDPDKQALILNDLLEAYRIFFNSQEFRIGVSEEIELISLSEVSYLFGASYANRIFSVKIKTKIKSDADIIHEYVNKRFAEYSQTLNNTIAAHTVELYNSYEYKIKDSAISDAQKAFRDSLQAQIEAVKATFASMNYEQILLFEEKVEMSLPEMFDQPYDKLGITVPKKANSNNTVQAKGIDKKKTIVGIFVGIILAFGYVWCSIIFSKKIKLKDDVKLIKGIEIYGPITERESVNKLDKKIYGIAKNTQENQFEYISSRISMDAKNANLKDLTVVSCGIDTQVIKDLFTKISIKNVEFKIAEGSLRNINALKVFDESNCILFVEKYNVTLRAEYENEIELALRNNKQILGTVMIV